MTTPVRKKRTKATKTLLLRYHCWTIEYDGSSWPSDSYILKKKGMRKVAYCGTLEYALKKMYYSIHGESARHRHNYNAELKDLAELIDDVKNEFTAILALSNARNCIQRHEDKNKGDAIQ